MVTPDARKPADIGPELSDLEQITPVPRGGKLTLSEQQHNLWFLYQLAPQSSVYSQLQVLRLRGKLDIASLTEAFHGLVARHESLRTRFGSEDGVPYQVIDPAPQTLSVPLSEGSEARIQDWINAEASIPFDLENGPLCRFSLLRVAADDHVLLMVWHHIIVDGWSSRQVSEELAVRYAAARRGAVAELPELAVQPADHAAWQRRWLLGDEAAEEISYWRETLAGAVPLEFPTDRPRPAQPTGAGAAITAALPADICRAVREFGQAEGISMLAILLAGFQIVVRRYTGQEDLAIGTLMSGRSRLELEPLVSFLANTVVLRGNLAGNPAFRVLAEQCQDTLLEALVNQDVPFGTLVEMLKPERAPGRNPLFQHLFTLMPAQMLSQFEFDDLHVVEMFEEEAAWRGTSRFDLGFQVNDQPDGGIDFLIEYSTELYDQGRIERLVEHLTVALSNALAAPDAGIDSVDILPTAERDQMLAEWNPLPSARDGRLLHEVFAARAAEAPERTAMRFAGAELSYGELDAQSSRLANVLVEAGARPGCVVGVLLERGFGLPVAELGVLKAGGAWLPMDTHHPAERLAYQLEDADVSLVVTTSDLAGLLPAHVSPVLLDSGALDGQPDSVPVTGVVPEDVAYVIYTSGSTGRPKGVMVPHRAAVNFCAAYLDLFRVAPGDRILQFANPAFDVSVSDFFATFAAGATVVGAPRSVLQDPDALQVLMREERVTFGDIPPAVLRLLDPGPLTDMRTLFIGMEPFGPELVNQWARPGLEFHNGYGPTEATITCVDYLCPEGRLTGLPPIGRAMANQRTYVLDKQLRLVPVGVPGELYMAGAGLAHGYLGRPELTAEKFLPDPFASAPGERMYATGDVVRWRSDGQLEFLGRDDRQVKIRGLRVELGEIEHVLAGYPGVRQATVVVKGLGTPQARLIGYFVPDTGMELAPSEIRDYLAAALPAHMVPAALLCLDEMPLTPIGKLDPARLPEPETAASDRAELSTVTQRRLAGIWSGLLELDADQLGPVDNFFVVGGNSLQVTRLISRIRDTFQVTLQPRDLFTSPVLEQLADQIDKAVGKTSDSATEAQLEAEIAELSEADLDRLLAEGGLQ